MTVSYNICIMGHVWKAFELSSTLQNNICNDGALPEVYNNSFKCIIAPHYYSKMELWTRNMEMTIAPVVPNNIERRWHSVLMLRLCLSWHLQRLSEHYHCEARWSWNLQEDYHAHGLPIEYVHDKSPYINQKLRLKWLESIEGWWRGRYCVCPCLQRRKAISAQPLWTWKEQRVTVFAQSAFTISPMMETSVQVHMRIKRLLRSHR